MRHVREVLRLRTAGISGNEIARRLNLAPSTVRLTLQRLATAGLVWPLPTELSDAVLEARLFSAAGSKQGYRRHSEPDWGEVHRELKRKHVTLQILWDEYIERCPDGYRYSRFCDLYRTWASRLSVTMRQSHSGGDKLFVDYAGDTVPVIIDRLNGKIRPAQIFVAALGASNFTYAEASWTQGLGDWIAAHIRAFVAIGGVPRLLVPDNTKVAVTKACLYEPQVNRSYTEMARITTPRSCRPRDKAKVEAAVLIIERWLLGRLRHRRFYCESAWNKDPVLGVIGMQSEPPGRRVHNGFHGGHGCQVGDADCGDDCEGSSGLFPSEEADQGDLPRVWPVAQSRAQSDSVRSNGVSLRAPPAAVAAD
jgi:transposase